MTKAKFPKGVGYKIKTHPIAWLNQPGYIGETLNPIRALLPAELAADQKRRRGWHCEKVSAGCANCYAEVINLSGRFGGTKMPYIPRSRECVILYLDETTRRQPLHWRSPRCIFWGDMSDLFGEWVSVEFLDWCLAIMADTPRHRHVLLTKRPERMAAYLNDDSLEDRLTEIWGEDQPDRDTYRLMLPLDHVWLGTSIEDQATAQSRIPWLLRCPAALHWLSLEPLLGPVNIPLDGIQWLVTGAESGPRRRPCKLEWTHDIIDQCKAAGVPVFVKQLDIDGKVSKDPAEWPAWARLRQFPETRKDKDDTR